MKLRKFIGERFGRLIVIGDTNQKQGYNKIYECKCDCGNITKVPSSSLGSNRTKSCGCLRKEKNKILNTKHGYHQSPTWRTWNGMKQRCLNSNNPEWDIYGGRGIQVCERWMKFENFLADMGERPEKHVLHREKNDEGYSPENCKWLELSKHVALHNKRR
jgi:hypothetical protein